MWGYPAAETRKMVDFAILRTCTESLNIKCHSIQIQDITVCYEPKITAETSLHLGNILHHTGASNLAILNCNPTTEKLRTLHNCMSANVVKVFFTSHLLSVLLIMQICFLAIALG